ncbi:MAG: TM2 domain-containing protein [Treponema sp.]|jgi:TM2 domain-containing membrane protein YozV|nr:TM2 domain-containing protein [Treponema sp.]MEE3434248.1 TM2 domain-containing protein [Treponema sp.]
MYCRNCGKELPDNTNFCPECGAAQSADGTVRGKEMAGKISRKSRTVAALLAFFLGYLGIHRFYVGKVGTGILQILATCCFGLGAVWALIDFVIILCGNFKDSDGFYLVDWEARY